MITLLSSNEPYPNNEVTICSEAKTKAVAAGIDKNKESSRAYEIKKILNQIGIKCKLTKDEMKIFGRNKIKRKSIKVSSLGDHRICMSASILALSTGVKTRIKNFETVKTSSPSFLKLIKLLGGKFEIKKTS